MEVSISDAAKMAGISRETFYRHIDEKPITIIDKNTKRPKVDVSELRRVYPNLKPLEEVIGKKNPANDTETLKAENDALKDKLQTLETERNRERRQLTETIENLRESLKKEQDSIGKVTALLSDQRGEAERKASQESEQAKKMLDLEKLVKDLVEQQKPAKKGWWFFGR